MHARQRRQIAGKLNTSGRSQSHGQRRGAHDPCRGRPIQYYLYLQRCGFSDAGAARVWTALRYQHQPTATVVNDQRHTTHTFPKGAASRISATFP